MRYYELGAQGCRASAVVMGCMRIAELEDGALSSLVRTALNLGINHFDHADIYGGGVCEERFGALLRAEPSLRDAMLLQSKCGIRSGFYDFSKDYILSSVDGILTRLGTDHLDFFLLHRPDALMEP